jgi:hypothetical protein
MAPRHRIAATAWRRHDRRYAFAERFVRTLRAECTERAVADGLRNTVCSMTRLRVVVDRCVTGAQRGR